MTRYIALALLILFFLLVTSAAGTKSATFDESVHIFSGWRILTQGDFATNHEHPPLMKVLCALPLVVAGVQPPRAPMTREVDEWSVAHEFVYHVNDGDRVLRLARLPVALLATVLAWAVYRFVAATLGPVAGMAALTLFVFEPNILAHSGLVTTDLAETAFTFFTFAAFVMYLRTRRRGWMIAAGVLLGCALLARFTGVLLIPILLICALLHVYLEGSRRWRETAVALGVIFATGLVALNLGYGFGGTFSSLRSFTPESQAFRDRAAGPMGALPLPVPREYVRGFDHAEAGGQRWWAYLFGRYSQTGWRHYYLTALAVKTPLPLLLLAAGGLLFWRRAARPIDALPPQVPLFLYLFLFTFSANLKNIGLRYILPVYPFLCILAGIGAMALTAAGAKAPAPKRSPGAAAMPWFLWVVLAAQAGAAAWIHPDYLTFFNLAVGGPSRGMDVLLDSNLDWGQDLKGLGRYIAEHRIDRIYVDYFGRACLRYYGVRSTPDFDGGWIAVSATNLKGVYAEDKQRYKFLWDRTPDAVIGHSIFVYNVERPAGWKPKGGAAAETGSD